MSLIRIKPLDEDQWNNVFNHVHSLNDLCNKEKPGTAAYIAYQKEISFFSEIVSLYNSIKESLTQESFLIKTLDDENDSEMKSLIKQEIDLLNGLIKTAQDNLLAYLFPPDKEETLSVFLEIRAGTGGLEASLFAKDLVKMYGLYAQRQRWEFSCIDIAETDLGGIREIILHIQGKNVYGHLRYESGVHRVQRVPDTEGSGRVHTSTATVAVLPEVDAVEVTIDEKDLRIDTYRASGAGGQHVNKTDSAVRITHIPTGIVVACQDERSQHKNRAKALKVLQARIYNAEKEKQENKVSQMRKEMVSSAERADKIRTYNYPQNRITDHRVGLTINRLDYIINQGEMEEIVEELRRSKKNDHAVHPLFARFYQ